MQTIYLDVLLFFNFCINYFLLRGTAYLTHIPCSLCRCLCSALLGSLFSLAIFLPPLPWYLSLLIRLGAAVCMNGLLCFRMPVRSFLRQTLWFFCLSLLLAGFLLAVQQLTNSRYLLTSNHCFYFSLSLPICILCTLFAYGCLRLWHMLRLRCHHTDAHYRVFIRIGTQTFVQEGLVDTGNNLVDLYSGLPVMVCNRALFSALLPQCHTKNRHFHYIPYATAAGTNMMPVFAPDEVLVQNVTTGSRQAVMVRIGMADTKDVAIFHPHLLQTV
jgi:stage II sporulation protein GA (sporulation sigma-E factor processing peptidase)